jgi:DNA-binding NtrC family response regulator
VVTLALGWCFGVGLAGVQLSVSMEMGALIAGATIATSPYAYEVVSRVVHLRDFFVTLFFVGLGMSIPVPDSASVVVLAAIVAAATHQDLEQRVAEGTFRQDLFYRLDVVPIAVPSLRDRLEDIPLLVDHFFAAARGRNRHSPVDRLAPALVTTLARYAWPGNVRELENLIERLVIVGTTPEIGVTELAAIAPAVHGNQERFSLPRDRLATLREVEEEYIAWMIERCTGNKTKAAEMLGIDPSTLHRRTRPRK